MISFKKNFTVLFLLGGVAIAGILLFINSLIKSAFILSSESAVQKASVIDIVMGTISLGLVLLGVALMAFLLVKLLLKKKVDATFILATITAAIIFIIAALLVVVKDHTSFANDWAKLNDIDKARIDVASNLAIANTMVGDRFGNKGFIDPAGTDVLDLAKSVPNPDKVMLNRLEIKDYNAFVSQVIQTKSDLAALYAIDELLNVHHQPLISAKLVDALACAYEKDNTITATKWINDTSTSQPYNLHSVISGFTTEDVNNPGKYIITNGLAGDAATLHTLSAMEKPFVFTSLTTTYLQGFPITLSAIVIALISLISFSVMYIAGRKFVKKAGA